MDDHPNGFAFCSTACASELTGQNFVYLFKDQRKIRMDTTQNIIVQDPLGLKRFALTESAYDLVNSLVGIYSRSIFHESEQINPDTMRMALWQERIDALQTLRSNGKWNDLFFLEQLIVDLANEYKQAIKQEEVRIKYAR